MRWSAIGGRCDGIANEAIIVALAGVGLTLVLNNEDAKRFLANAMGFLLSTKAISEIPGPLVHYPALYVNLYYSLELALKAYLASRGHDRRKLKQISHNLGDLLSLAASLGLTFRDPRATRLIGQMDRNLMDLRYLDGPGFQVEEPEIAIQILSLIIEDVAHAIPASDLH